MKMLTGIHERQLKKNIKNNGDIDGEQIYYFLLKQNAEILSQTHFNMLNNVGKEKMYEEALG